MATGPKLDIPTLLICGHLLLVITAGALTAVRSVPTRPCCGSCLWIGSIAVFLLPGALLMAESHVTWPAPLPPRLALVAGLLASASALQWFALRAIAGRALPRARIAIWVVLACLITGAVAWVLPQAYGAKLIAGVHLAVPLLAMPSLRVIVRGGVGGVVTALSIALGALANAVALSNGINANGNDPSVLILADILALFGATLGLLLWHQERIQRLLTQTAVTDALTGTLNRHGLMRRLEAELSRACRSGGAVSIVLCDLDHFKRVNDTYGHAVGDLVLNAFATSAMHLLRQGNLVGRWGGEEFLFVLPDTATQDADFATERVREAQAPAMQGMPVVTVSAGIVTSGRDGSCYSPDELLAAADKLLYVAKETRNRAMACWPAEDSASRDTGVANIGPRRTNHLAPCVQNG